MDFLSNLFGGGKQQDSGTQFSDELFEYKALWRKYLKQRLMELEQSAESVEASISDIDMEEDVSGADLVGNLYG